MLTKPQVFYDDTHKQALGYQNSFYLKKDQRIKPMLYDGYVISKKHDVIYMVDEEETLMLEEESRSKILAKQNDLILKEEKINISPINYFELNKLAEDFGKRFVPQKELSAEQAFWLQFSNPISKQLVFKLHLLERRLQVVKVRTTPDVITEGLWGFKHTKAVLMKEVIPFIKPLRGLFNDFDNGLNLELNEVKIVFNQMEADLKQCSVDMKYLDIQKKEIFLDNDRLLEHIMCQEVMNIVMHNDFIPVNVLPANNKCLMNDNLESERLIQENDHLFKLLLSQDIVYICINSLSTLTNYAKMKHDYIDEYSENLVLKVELAKKEQTAEKKFFDEVNHIESLIGKNVIEKDITLNKAKVIAPGMFKLDLEPLSPKEVLVYVTATCPSLTKPSEKLVAITPLNKNKKVRFAEHATSSSSIQKQEDSHKIQDSNKLVLPSTRMKSFTNIKHSMLNANSELICATCYGCMFDAIHDSFVLDFVNDVNVRSKSKYSKSSKKKTTWKPTGKVFTTVGYKWIPTSRKFSIEGNRFPLTRITSTNVVPPKNLLPTKVAKKATPRRNNPKMIKDVTNKSSSSRCCLNCSLVFGLRMLQAYDRKPLFAHQLFHKFLGTVRFGNDQIAKIMGYGKSKKHIHNPKAEDSIQEKLYLLHIDLCEPIRIQSTHGRKYILVIVDDYSWFTWVKFLRSKDEVPEFVIKFLKMIQVRLNATVRNIRTDNGTEFVNQTLRAYYEDVGISHQTSIARSP
ncbi:retrovirus-related pol polyprotein from transposon TNT 1-94 [Tanacetum coccineum]